MKFDLTMPKSTKNKGRKENDIDQMFQNSQYEDGARFTQTFSGNASSKKLQSEEEIREADTFNGTNPKSMKMSMGHSHKSPHNTTNQ